MYTAGKVLKVSLIKLFMFQYIDAWIRDKDLMVKANDTGRDLEHCNALKRKFGSDMRVDDQRTKSINVLDDKLVLQGKSPDEIKNVQQKGTTGKPTRGDPVGSVRISPIVEPAHLGARETTILVESEPLTDAVASLMIQFYFLLTNLHYQGVNIVMFRAGCSISDPKPFAAEFRQHALAFPFQL
ncbi:CLUMA_CG002088, isoform A [Clunio marinus]|uniref:CLUMA_CG002088, isoform A n=1 Tax=Clunio marinus TaxID=568069 RepID=A0A1J1HJV7_9DIPT|nr:CLUMA_CG002088, isoform A [Clunio marinus]